MKPNFFIIGAPKCGTTSIASWLRDHREVFIPSIKEPHFFNFDSGHRDIKTLREYERLYKGAKKEQLAIGDASVWYLLSSVAVKNILAYQAHAKFIICIRNPLEMCESLHDEMVFGGDEQITDFEAAWDAQFERREFGRNLPRVCVDLRYFMYGEACKLGEQIARVIASIPKNHLLIVNLDDIKTDPKAQYSIILNFLGLSPEDKQTFPVENSAKERKIMLLRRVMRYGHLLKNRLGVYKGTGLMAMINKWNTRPRKRTQLSDEMKNKLNDFFKEDVDLLRRLTGLELYGWPGSNK